MLKLQNMDKAASLNMAGRMPDGPGQPYKLGLRVRKHLNLSCVSMSTWISNELYDITNGCRC